MALTPINMKLTPGHLYILVWVFCYGPGAWAGEVRRADVTYRDGFYMLDFDAVINGRYDEVHRLVSDYANLHELSDAVQESVILGSPRPGERRLKFVAQVCILIFCFTKTLVADVTEHPEGVFNATVVPRLCDFKSGHGNWRFSAAGPSRTLVHYTGVQQPAFWIPPVIGPYLLRHKLVKEAISTIKNLERLSNHV